MVGAVGFEPTTSCSQSTCAAAALHPDGFVLAKRMCFAIPVCSADLHRSDRIVTGLRYKRTGARMTRATSLTR